MKKRAMVFVCCIMFFSASALAETSAATLQFGGDVLIQTAVLQSAHDGVTDTYDFGGMFKMVAPLLAETDLTVLNLEVPIAGGKYTGYPQFNSPPALLTAIQETGTDLVLCANNHALDRLAKGVKKTIENIEAAGLRHIGTARNTAEFNEVPLFDLNGITVAIFNYTQHTNGMEKNDTPENLRSKVHYFGVKRAERDIKAAREAGADFVILCVHWGKEYVREPNEWVANRAQDLCALGADLVIGGHPHVLQPIVTLTHTDKKTGAVNESLVAYSTGNFLSGQRDQYRDSGALFRFTIEKGAATGETTITKYGYIPTWVWLGEKTGEYVVLPMEQAIERPPEDMTDGEYARLRDAFEETTALLGEDRIWRE